MSGMELDSNFLLKKCCGCAGIDWISQLPDEIISHILSLLPLKEVVATSILSPRWLNLWKYTPNLNFANDTFLDPMINIPITMPIGEPIERILERSLKNTEWVNSVLNSYKALSLKQFSISFYVHPVTFNQVSKWLHFAFSRQVESLKLNFRYARFVLDINIFSGIQSSDYKFLRELTLKNFNVSGEAIEFLLSSCSVLEGLIVKATLTSDLVIGGTLKYLKIISSRRDGKFIKVSAPNLTLLGFNYDLEKLLLENVPNLVEASFDLYRDDTMLHFAKAAAKLEILTISLDQPKAFPVPEMPKLKKLAVNYYSVKKNKFLLPITCLLQASPCLEEFKLEISDFHNYLYHSSISKGIFEVPKVGGFPHYHLKIFEFSGFTDEAPDHVKLVRYIANNCVGLEKIIITPKSANLSRQVTLRSGSKDMKRRLLAEEVGIEEEQEMLDMKKSTEKVLAGKIPDRIELLIN